MRRHELRGEHWALIADLFPVQQGAGRRFADHRRIVNAWMWILHTGSAWRDLPDRYGPWKTAYNRFLRARDEGLLDRILERLQMRLDEEGLIDWDLWCVDGSSVRADVSAAGAGKKGEPPSPPITRWAAAEAGLAPRSTWSLTATACR